MDFEGLENYRAENAKKVMDSMAEMATDKKAEPKDRLEAAKIVDAMSDSIIKARILTETNQSIDELPNKLTKQIKDLDKE